MRSFGRFTLENGIVDYGRERSTGSKSFVRFLLLIAVSLHYIMYPNEGVTERKVPMLLLMQCRCMHAFGQGTKELGILWRSGIWIPSTITNRVLKSKGSLFLLLQLMHKNHEIDVYGEAVAVISSEL